MIDCRVRDTAGGSTAALSGGIRGKPAVSGHYVTSLSKLDTH